MSIPHRIAGEPKSSRAPPDYERHRLSVEKLAECVASKTLKKMIPMLAKFTKENAFVN